jgi:hypothetical protein
MLRSLTKVKVTLHHSAATQFQLWNQYANEVDVRRFLQTQENILHSFHTKRWNAPALGVRQKLS